jgi:hypothetical protein
MLENLKDELNLFRKRVIQQAKSNLTRMGKRSSGKLYDSLKSDVEVYKSGNFMLEFDLGRYGSFVDEGVKGADPKRVKNGKQKAPNSRFKFKSSKKTIPTKVLDKWVVTKGLAPKDKSGKFTSRKSLKYLIARSIHAQGLKPSLFFTKPFENEFSKLSEDLVEAFGLDVDEFLKYTLNKYE